ncbi:MAG: isoprenylcysteine carboxylmethyltransferase family protein [Pontimonas sp.]|jgi:protein-S-isoprenylcysteine O-methyltransferase Ste14|nr:isoprenylcysteine carboxylmethyltransferase family protein [Pontimonas sp.]MDP4688991.1 isoprenylcysteine carboxylmethyltransferase family protein [Pontimonas sp.]MDP4816788.1 isoprenylcysteine carboxylmethyltransferase family protein [Pontimonas sp.]MDP4972809.1 isoprenylcysteine carboxylmethyltransferase family protein [Pontimonas sp.]MDP5128978.1 isoprenylcysteine carboxylmethyltransferase family protein [Pontimonas sp.]
MTPSTGWALVGAQFGLLVALVILPAGDLWPRGAITSVLGGVLVATGAAVAVLAGLRLGPNLTPTPLPKEDGELVTAGFYQYVRHPIYTGVLLAAAGVLVFQASIAHIVGFVLVWGVLTLKALGEEKMLAEKYEGYASYASRTGRFLPRVTSAQ